MAKEERKYVEAFPPAARVPVPGKHVVAVERWFEDHFHGCSHPWFTTEVFNYMYSAVQDLKARLEKEA